MLALMKVTNCDTHKIRVYLGSEQCQHYCLCKSTTLLTISDEQRGTDKRKQNQMSQGFSPENPELKQKDMGPHGDMC